MTAMLVIIHVLVCVFLTLVVLLQQGNKQGGMGGAFGGGGSATVFGGRGANTFLAKLTAGAAALFMVTSLSLSYISSHATSAMDDEPDTSSSKVDGKKDDAAKPEKPATDTAPADMAAAKPADARFESKLASGFVVTGNATGIESGLLGFIQDATRPADKTTWFDFDRLTFQTGKADLEMDKSKEQLANVAEILKAFPKVKLKVGGYTDNTGAADANKKLSQARADSVAAQLVALGVAKDRLDPEGYGSEYPVCAANDTEECKAKNRRIALRVSEK